MGATKATAKAKSTAKAVCRLSAAALLLGLSFCARGSEPGYKETVMEAGRIKLAAQIKDGYAGPTNFNGSKGMVSYDDLGWELRQASWGRKLESIKGYATLRIKVVADSKVRDVWKKENLFEEMLALQGLGPSKSQELYSFNMGIDGAYATVYRAIGERHFDVKDGVSCAMYLVVWEMQSLHSSLAFSADACGRTDHFNANKEIFEKVARDEFLAFKKGLKLSLIKEGEKKKAKAVRPAREIEDWDGVIILVD